MTQDFFLGQLRLIAVAVIAFCAGKGWLSTDTTTLLGTVLAPAGLLFGPWLWSIYANVNRKLVPKDSVAISAQSLSAHDGTVPLKIVGAILLALILAPHGTLAADLPLKVRNANAAAAPTPATVAAKLAQLTQTDLKFASDLATAAGTPQAKVRLQCYQAIIAIAIPDFSKVPNPHVISDFEYSAELIDGLQPTSPVMVQCAGAAQLFALSALQFVNQFVTGALAVTALVPKIP